MSAFIPSLPSLPSPLSRLRSPRTHPRRPPSRPPLRMTATDPRLLPFSAGVSALENEGAYAVMAAATAVESATGKPVIHLEIGQPAFPTPAPVADAAIAAIAAGKTKYSSPRGVAPLRAAIASWANRHRALSVGPQHVVVGPGAKPGLFLATLALVRGPHDHVLIPDPGFPTYRAMVAVANGTPVPVALRPDMRSFDMRALEAAITHRTRLVVLNSPGNPTGGVVPLEDLRRIAQLAVEHDFWVVSDEIYSQLCYDDTYTSIASLPGMADRTVVVDGFSKSYCMTGWRLGWAIMPPALAERVELLLVHSVGCTATFTQEAGIAALAGGGEVEMLRREYRKRRDIVVEGLNAIPGVRCDTPQGAFYAFADVRSFGRSSKEIADVLLQDGLVAVLPGTDFGEQGEGFIRLSYVSEEEELREGLRRIAATLGKLPPVKAVA